MIFVCECLCVGLLGAENNKWKRKNRRRKSTKSFVGGPSGKTQNIEMCQSIQSIAATFSHSYTHRHQKCAHSPPPWHLSSSASQYSHKYTRIHTHTDSDTVPMYGSVWTQHIEREFSSSANCGSFRMYRAYPHIALNSYVSVCFSHSTGCGLLLVGKPGGGIQFSV